MREYLEEKIKEAQIDIDSARAIENYQDAFKNQIRLTLLKEILTDSSEIGLS